MKYSVMAAMLVLLSPGISLAAEPLGRSPSTGEAQTLELSAKAQVEGATVPLDVVVSTENTNVTLNAAKKEGATAVTFTLYLTPKPKPAPAAASSSAAAAVESSGGIQQSIAGVSPQAASTLAPVFTLVDGGRSKAADVLDSQIAATKARLGAGAGSPSEVLGSEDVKRAGTNPMGAFWYVVQTLYLYLLTILRFVIGSAGVFYPVLAVALLFALWKIFRRFRRPSY